MSEPNDIDLDNKIYGEEIPLDSVKSLALLENYLKSCVLRQTEVVMTRKDGINQKISFNVVRKIGQGSFGVVSKIKEHTSKTELALKAVYINPKYYYRELDILRQLSHPCIINLLGFYKIKVTSETEMGLQSNLCVCLITPYAKYTMLDVMKNRAFYIPRIKDLFWQALSALAYMHSKNICHRDIKPTNILVDEKCKLYICDLGSAKEIVAEEENVSYICSRYYRAPECCLGFTNYGTNIDVWSLSVVFAEFVLDSVLFAKENNQAQVRVMQNLLEVSNEDFFEMKLPSRMSGIGIKEHLRRKRVMPDLIDVLSRGIVLNPRKRASAVQLMNMQYFA